jgi:hypothetical protein
MKVRKQTTQPEFRPYTLSIEIETYEDEVVLQELSKAQYTIPELLYQTKNSPCIKSAHQFNLAQTFLNKLYIAIKS